MNRLLTPGRSLACLALLAFAVTPSASSQEMTIGNGEKNSIVVDGMSLEARTFTFREVTLAEPGWLVLHPFEGGEAQGEIYVGAKYLPAGTHESVTIDVQTAPEPAPGTQFIVMLHGDVDRDETFDFFFVDETNVADKAVFEGSTMIGHVHRGSMKAPFPKCGAEMGPAPRVREQARKDLDRQRLRKPASHGGGIATDRQGRRRLLRPAPRPGPRSRPRAERRLSTPPRRAAASARNDVVQADTKSIGKSPERVNGAGSATRFDVNDLDAAGVGGAGQGGLRKAPVLAPDPQRRLAVDQPADHRLRKELLLPGVDSRLNSERGLNVGQILLDAAQALILGLRDRHGVSHGSLP